MSSCRCCLKPHPLSLIERFNLSIQTIKLIRRNCSIFENLLLDEYEHLERIISNLNKYLMRHTTKSTSVLSYLSQANIQLNRRLENSIRSLNQYEYLRIKCSVWLKTYSKKSIHSRLKYYRKQFEIFNNSLGQNFTRKSFHNFSIFQKNYHQFSLQMDSIEHEHIKLLFESIQLFSPLENLDKINVLTIINDWKENHKIHLTWLPNEHQNSALSINRSSDIDIRAIDDSSSQDKYTIKSNLSWSFTIAQQAESPSVGFCRNFFKFHHINSL